MDTQAPTPRRELSLRSCRAVPPQETKCRMLECLARAAYPQHWPKLHMYACRFRMVSSPTKPKTEQTLTATSTVTTTTKSKATAAAVSSQASQNQTTKPNAPRTPKKSITGNQPATAESHKQPAKADLHSTKTCRVPARTKKKNITKSTASAGSAYSSRS